jgi:hypothetical protein
MAVHANEERELDQGNRPAGMPEPKSKSGERAEYAIGP